MRNKGSLAAFWISVLAMLCYLYPVVFAANRKIASFYSSDELYGVIWSFWWLKYSYLNHLSANYIFMICYPFGVVDSSIWFFPIWSLLAKYIGILANEVLAYNLILLSSFPLAALFMYKLSFLFTRSKAAGIFSCLIYAFCVFHFVRLWQHFGTAQIQWMPLYLFCFFRFIKDADIKSSFFLGASLALNYYFDVHYAYFMAIASSLILLAVFCNRRKFFEKLKLAKYYFFSLAVFFLIILPALLPFLGRFLSTAQDAISVRSLRRPFEDLFTQSARPLSYILPFSEHPVFGKITNYFVGTKLWGESLTEHNLFLGYTALFLCAIAFKNRKKIFTTFKQESFSDGAFYYYSSFALILIGWLFSQPPWWEVAGLKFYLPSYFLYKILPMFRAYSRFGIVVMLGVSLFSGFGLSFVLSRLKKPALKFPLLILVCAFALFESWSLPQAHTIDLSRYPSVYDILRKKNEDFVIAEYPLDTDAPNELYKFYQTKHKKKIINAAHPDTAANFFLRQMACLSSYQVSRTLSAMNVKYALVHRQAYLDTGLESDRVELERIATNSDLEFIASSDGVDLYQIAPPAMKKGSGSGKTGFGR